MKPKKGMVWPEIGWWILMFAIVGIIILFIMVLKGKGIPVIDKIVSIFTGGSSA